MNRPLLAPFAFVFAFVFCVAFVAFVAPTHEARADESPPNIVFFFTDDQAHDTLGCAGHYAIQSPNIDALAARGVRFENAFVSQSICWVSRTTVLTGLTGRSYGTPGDPELARPGTVDRLVSDELRDVGYRTGFFGKWHAKMPQGYRPEDHFDEYEHIFRNPFFKSLPDGTLRHETDLIVDRGIDFVRSQPEGVPFALNLWFNAMHAEDADRRPGIGHFTWPQSADGMYDDLAVYPPRLHDPAIFEALPEFFQISIARERYFWRYNTPWKFETNARAYFRMVSGVDAAVGRLLAALEETGLADNTIVVYTSDNGFHMGNRGLAGKWSHYEESIRVPLIVADPRVPAERQGRVVEEFALNLDFPSTFLDWAGAEIPEQYQGRSLRPVVEGETPADWREETFHEHFAVRHRIPAFEGIRTAEFKYARYFDHDHEFLHDLKNDPDELVNLAGDPAHAETLADLRRRTEAQVAAYGGPLEPLAEFQASTVPHPEAAANVSAQPRPDGFVPVFNGNNLNNWDGDPAYWSVEDRALTGTADGTLKRNHFLSWKHNTIRNFELRAKVKITEGGNSGIQYRSVMRPEIGLDSMSGYQCDVVANRADYHGMLYEERGRRILSHTGEKVVVDPEGQPWVVGELPPAPEPRPGEWQDFRVVVRGNHHRHWIDGHPTVDLVDLDEHGRVLEGILAVQVHTGPAMQVQYKDFLIRHLPDDLPLETADAHPLPEDARWVRPQRRLPEDWEAPKAGRPSGDLTDGLDAVSLVCGGRPRLAVAGALELTGVILPELDDETGGVHLRLWGGIDDHVSGGELPRGGVAFRVLVDGEEIHREVLNRPEWLPLSIDLSDYAGRGVAIAFEALAPGEGGDPVEGAAWSLPSLFVTRP